MLYVPRIMLAEHNATSTAYRDTSTAYNVTSTAYNAINTSYNATSPSLETLKSVNIFQLKPLQNELQKELKFTTGIKTCLFIFNFNRVNP